MAGFLTDAWLDDLDVAAQRARLETKGGLVVQQIIPDGPDGREVAYAVVVAAGRASVVRGRAAEPDVTFTQDLATAEAIHRGELSAQAAFMQGRLRLGGDLRAVIDRAGELAAIDDLFASARA
ncbi:MAG: SCP2 sterol-binding domain-containing protein [Acidimicrobiales bacterium]